MKLLTSSLPLLALALQLTSAAPAAEPGSNEIRDNTIDLRVCSNSHFEGVCQTFHAQAWKCYNLGSGLSNSVSSVKTETDTVCRLYFDGNCSGRSFKVGASGYGDLSFPGVSGDTLNKLGLNGVNDKASSYRCSTTCGVATYPPVQRPCEV
ncbi:hypothetical protein FE257_004940 [Aspergillus nanangensis]|uniref:Uncharacterized protein n=1 Tax=Aspergillus nanangensis TaxID=2582783 RepID=A0AAD4GM94_ASPNN|nr:hypothetical protein FE257_004940 [Aspergillus nanangensis]